MQKGSWYGDPVTMIHRWKQSVDNSVGRQHMANDGTGMVAGGCADRSCARGRPSRVVWRQILSDSVRRPPTSESRILISVRPGSRQQVQVNANHWADQTLVSRVSGPSSFGCRYPLVSQLRALRFPAAPRVPQEFLHAE